MYVLCSRFSRLFPFCQALHNPCQLPLKIQYLFILHFLAIYCNVISGNAVSPPKLTRYTPIPVESVNKIKLKDQKKKTYSTDRELD